MSPRGMAAFVTTLFVGRLVGRIPLRWLLCFGFTMLSTSAFMLSDINLQVSMTSVIFPTVLNGVAISFIFVPLTTAAMSQLRQQQIGSATGLYNLMLNIGGSIGIATVTTMIARGSQAHQALMVGHLTPTDPAFRERLAAAQAMLARHSDPVTATHQAYALIYNILNQQAHLWAFVDTFRVFGLMVLCCIPLIFLFKRIKQPAIRVVEVQ
jgi:DHA2 family multidrug resistance protein